MFKKTEMSTKRKIIEEMVEESERKEEKKIKRRVKSAPTSTTEQDLLVLLYHAIKLSAQTLRSPDEAVSYSSRHGSAARAGERESCWRHDRVECTKHPECVLGFTVGAVGGRERKRLRSMATVAINEEKKVSSVTSTPGSVITTSEENYLCEYRGDLRPYWLGSVIEVPPYSRQYFRLVGIAESVGGVHLPALFFEDVSDDTRGTQGTVYLIFAPMTELYESKEYPKNFQALSRYFCGRWMVAPYKDQREQSSGRSSGGGATKIMSKVFIHGGTWKHWQSLKDNVVVALGKLRPKHLVVGGFSLGGALAQLAAFDLSFTTNLAAFNISRMSVCSAGTFRVGNLAWREVWEQVLLHPTPGLVPKVELMNLALGAWNTSGNLELDPITQIPVANVPDNILFEPLPLHTLTIGPTKDKKLIHPDEMRVLFLDNRLVTIKNDSDFDICGEMFPMIAEGKLKLPAEVKEWRELQADKVFVKQFPLVMSMINRAIAHRHTSLADIKRNVEKMHHAFFYAEEIRKYLIPTLVPSPRDVMFDWESRNDIFTNKLD